MAVELEAVAVLLEDIAKVVAAAVENKQEVLQQLKSKQNIIIMSRSASRRASRSSRIVQPMTANVSLFFSICRIWRECGQASALR